MFYARVESQDGQRLNVQLPNGLTAGKVLLAFISGLDQYCSGANEESWFRHLAQLAKGKLCGIAQPLLQSWISGDWNYAEDEYYIFLHRFPDDPMTEDEFKKTMRTINSRWVDIAFLLKGVEGFLELFKQNTIEADEAWYDPVATPLEFEALQAVLTTLTKWHAEKVRIEFY